MYRRNQVETAIERAIYGVRTTPHVATVLRVRIKRLIETDRGLGVDKKSNDQGNRHYAFFDDPPPGRGTEITYSVFSTFALYLALRLMDGGLPQSEAVVFMRRIRPDIEREHSRILARNPENLIDHRPAGTVDDEVKAGRLVLGFDQMVFLVALAGQVTVQVSDAGKVAPANIIRGKTQLIRLLTHLATLGNPITCIELVNPGHQLAYWLSKTEPVRRGRK